MLKSPMALAMYLVAASLRWATATDGRCRGRIIPFETSWSCISQGFSDGDVRYTCTSSGRGIPVPPTSIQGWCNGGIVECDDSDGAFIEGRPAADPVTRR